MPGSPSTTSLDWHVKSHFRHTRQGAENEILDARLRRRRHRNGVAIAAKAGGDPEDIQFGDRRRLACRYVVALHRSLQRNVVRQTCCRATRQTDCHERYTNKERQHGAHRSAMAEARCQARRLGLTVNNRE